MKIQKQRVVSYSEEIPQDLKDFERWEFSTGGTTGEDFNLFARLFKKYIKNNLPLNAELISFSKGHYILSGFIKKKDRFIYFSISDVRCFKNEWLEHILIRTAQHDKDYTGGRNCFTTLKDFRVKVEQLFND